MIRILKTDSFICLFPSFVTHMSCLSCTKGTSSTVAQRLAKIETHTTKNPRPCRERSLRRRANRRLVPEVITVLDGAHAQRRHGGMKAATHALRQRRPRALDPVDFRLQLGQVVHVAGDGCQRPVVAPVRVAVAVVVVAPHGRLQSHPRVPQAGPEAVQSTVVRVPRRAGKVPSGKPSEPATSHPGIACGVGVAGSVVSGELFARLDDGRRTFLQPSQQVLVAGCQRYFSVLAVELDAAWHVLPGAFRCVVAGAAVCCPEGV